MVTLQEIVEAATKEGADAETLLRALVAREDNMADHLRLAGAQFGLYPEIVAEVLVQVGLGTQPDDEMRQMIHNNFVTLMDKIAEQNRDGQ